MENRSSYTIKTLLEELKSTLPAFRQGMIFETKKTIFPNNDLPRKKRNITYKNISFTKPLACSAKDKQNYLKEDSPIADFFKETTRGDFLEVIEVSEKIAKCKNVSLNEEIKNTFYNEDATVEINYDDVANGTVRQYRRRINKFFHD